MKRITMTRSVLVTALGMAVGVGFVAGRSLSAPSVTRMPSTGAGAKAGATRASELSSLNKTSFSRRSAGSAVTRVENLEAQLLEAASFPPRKRWERYFAIARSIAPGDAPGALALAGKILPWDHSSPFRRQLLAVWAEAEPRSALAYAETLTNRHERTTTACQALTHLAELDPDAALGWLETHAAGEDRRNFLVAVFEGIAAQDPGLAFDKLSRLPIHQQHWVRHKIIEQLAQSDPRKAMDLVLESREVPGQLENIVHIWMGKDRDAAIAWLQSQPQGIRNRCARQALASLGWQDPAAAVALLNVLPHRQPRNESLQQLLVTWADRDVDALRAWTDSRTDPRERSLGQMALAQELSTTDPAAAAAALQQIKPDGARSWAFFQSVFNNLALQDPRRAVEMAKAVGDPVGRNMALSSALAGWAQADPLAAATYAVTLPGGAARSQALNQIANDWAQEDPKAMLDWMRQVPSPGIQRDAFRNIISELGRSSPELAAEFLVTLPVGQGRSAMTVELVSNWAIADFDGALGWVKQLPEGPARSKAFEQISSQWHQHDEQGAVDFAKSLPPGELRDQIHKNLGQVMSSRDPNEAADFALSLPQDAGRQQMLESIVQDWSSSDPQAASKFAWNLPDGSGRQAVLRQVAEHWAQNDPTSALAWVESFPSGKGRTEAMSGVLGQWAAQSPEAAAAYIGKLSEGERGRGLAAVIPAMVEADPAYTASWIQQFPESDMRSEAQESLMNRWAREDPNAAANWLAGLPEGESRDKAVRPFVQHAAEHNPPLAWDWAMTLSDPASQVEALETAGRQWLRTDDSAARSAIHSSGLPQEVMDGLLAP